MKNTNVIVFITFTLLALVTFNFDKIYPTFSKVEASTISFSRENVDIQLRSGEVFTINAELATTPTQLAQGLKYRRNLADDQGMLFLFEQKDKHVTMWMEDTPIPLDILFIDRNGTIINIVENTVPYSRDIISSVYPVSAALELKGGMVKKQTIILGDKVLHSSFN